MKSDDSIPKHRGMIIYATQEIQGFSVDHK